MKKLIISGVFCSVLLLGGFQVASAEETTTTTSNTEMLAKIQDLMKLIADLQAKLTAARGEIQELAADLSEGAEGDDVKKAQEILASDPTLFGAKPTGYFGPMTREALKKFQERYGLEVTGKLDEATRDVMKELRKERKNGMVPPGLIKSGEIKDRILARLHDKWGKDDEDDDMDDSDDDSADDSDDDDSTDATREEARAAIASAQDDIAEFKITIDDMDRDEMKDGLKTLRDAQKKLFEARMKLMKNKFDEAVEKAEEASDIIAGDDEDSADDEDDDSDDDDEDDEDDDDDDEDEDEDDSDEDDD